MKLPKLVLTPVLLAVAAGLSARAGLQVPYTPDADTLHLWHFDDSIANQGTANYVTITDAVAVANGGITLTNLGLSLSGNPPFTNIFLVTNDAAPKLKQSLNILPSDGSTAVGASHAMCAGPSDMAPTAFANSSSGAFTFEAIVNPQGNIFNSAAGSGEWEIFCGDNSTGTRGWQFRLQNAAVPVMDFNFISASGGSAVNQTFNLPTTGPDALATNQWYHVAVTYTGNTPTNSDPAGVLTFYWTLFDPNRTNADVLGAITNSALGTIGGTPSPAIGGSQRTTHGVGNGGSFQGFIDEVRVSDICRQAISMAFTTNAVINPPTFVGGSEPPASTFLGYGQPLNVTAVVLGTQPIAYQWQVSSTGNGGWSNVTGQTNNTLSIPAVTFANAGFYHIIATNAALANNSVTSSVAQVIVGAVPSELFNTGINTNGVLDTTLAGNPDPHYTIVQSPDPNYLGPEAIVWDMSTYPIAADNGGFANIDGVSQWIGTENDSYTSVNGEYIYRTYFVMDTVDTTRPITISGTWWDNSIGNDILINGQSTGNVGASENGTGSVAFSITKGFQPGLNMLDFVVTKDANNGGGAYQESAVRVEIHGLGYALPAGVPFITNQPVSQTVEDANYASGSVATFSVVALGQPPLSYQWWADGAAISGATNRSLVFDGPSSTPQPGTNFTVVVSNASGSVTSSVAMLTLVSTDAPPVVPNYSLVIYSNTTATFNLDTAFEASTDPNNFPLSLGNPAFDSSSTNGGSISQNEVILTYTPVQDYLGQDEFNYYIQDSQGTTSAGAVNVNVVPLVAPGVFKAANSAGNIVLSGGGASAGGSFHVLQSTNLTTPLSNWATVLSTNFNKSGGFNIAMPVSAGVPQSFYLISVP